MDRFMLSSYLHTHISHCLVLLTFVHTSVIALIPLIGVSSWNMAFFWWETMKKWETDRHCSWGRTWRSERMKTKKMEGAAKVRKGIWKTPALSQVQQCVYSCKVCVCVRVVKLFSAVKGVYCLKKYSVIIYLHFMTIFHPLWLLS